MTCPDCNDGIVLIAPFKPFARFPDDYNIEERDCRTCDGTGEIEEAAVSQKGGRP